MRLQPPLPRKGPFWAALSAAPCAPGASMSTRSVPDALYESRAMLCMPNYHAETYLTFQTTAAFSLPLRTAEPRLAHLA